MKKLIILLMVLLPIIGYGQQLPQKTDKNNQIINHNGYVLSYNEDCEQPNWVFYKLTRDDIKTKDAERKNNFKVDPKVKTGSATLEDYKGSGYDRGHLKSAADESVNQEQMDETFYMSNMSPQEPSFNRGIWKKLENYVRKLALENDSLHIITGGILTGKLKTIGENKVCVPEFYYKIIHIFNNKKVKTYAYVLPNKGSKKRLYEYEATLNAIEKLSGIDFTVKF